MVAMRSPLKLPGQASLGCRLPSVDAPEGAVAAGRRSGHAQLYGAEAFDGELDPVAALHGLGGDDAAGDHEIAAQQAAAVDGEVVGDPGDGVERVAHAVAGTSLADALAVDGGDGA